MPEWQYGTRPKAGGPESINLGYAVIETMFAGTPLPWLLPVYALIDPIDIDIATLCASEPPASETWGFNDVFNALDPARHQLAIDKIVRMALASQWPTYCEYAPVPPEDYPSPVLRSQSMAGSFNGATPRDPLWYEFPIDPGDMYAFVVTCTTPLTTGGTPSLVVVRPDDSLSVNFANGWPISGSVTEVFVLTHDLGVAPNPFLGVYETMEPNTGVWRINLPVSDGQWDVTVWNFDFGAVPGPDDAQVWPEAPAQPSVGQLTDEQIGKLVTMANEWNTHRITTAILPGMLTDLDLTVNERADDLVALINGLGIQPATGFEDGGSNTLVTANASFNIPPGVVGFYVYIEETAGARILGNNPEAYYDVAWVAQGWGEAYWPSEQVKHNPTVFHPLKPGADTIAFDLHPSCAVSFNWLVPSSP